jgi:hypothetical protein
MLWGSVRVSLLARICLNQAVRVQVAGDWLPGHPPQPSSACAAATPQPGSAGTSESAIPTGPGWPGATVSLLRIILVHDL